MDDGVDGAGGGRPFVNFVQVGDDGLFVGDGNIDAGHAGGAQAGHESGDGIGIRGDGIGAILGGNAQGVQGSLLEAGGNGMSDRPADDAKSGTDGGIVVGVGVRHNRSR